MGNLRAFIVCIKLCVYIYIYIICMHQDIGDNECIQAASVYKWVTLKVPLIDL